MLNSFSKRSKDNKSKTALSPNKSKETSKGSGSLDVKSEKDDTPSSLNKLKETPSEASKGFVQLKNRAKDSTLSTLNTISKGSGKLRPKAEKNDGLNKSEDTTKAGGNCNLKGTNGDNLSSLDRSKETSKGSGKLKTKAIVALSSLNISGLNKSKDISKESPEGSGHIKTQEENGGTLLETGSYSRSEISSIPPTESRIDDSVVHNPTSLSDPATMVYGGWLLLGPVESASSKEFLVANEITHVFSIGSKPSEKFPDIVTYSFIDVLDTDTAELLKSLDECKFCHTIKKIGNEYRNFKNGMGGKKQKALIHCKKGISRSPTSVIYYLWKEEKHDMLQAFARVVRNRKKVNPRRAFVTQLKRVETKNMPHKSTLSFLELPGIVSKRTEVFVDVKLEDEYGSR